MEQESHSFRLVDYCRYWLSSQKNFTITNLANHLQTVSHDLINSFLRNVEVTPELLWLNGQNSLQPFKNDYIIFDDTILDKNYSKKIELVRRQYSGNAKKVIRGIGLVVCMYNQCYLINYRIFDKDGDGKSTGMDSWYATTKVMKYMDEQEKIYYCPLIKVEGGYQRVEHLSWEQGEKFKLVRPRGFPAHKQVNVSTNNTEYIITNDPDSLSPEEVKEEYSKRWQVEVFYRELKQTTGGSKAQIQRNHIGCALLVWVKLKEFANTCKTSVYAIKQQIMSHWLSWELKYPLFAMSLA